MEDTSTASATLPVAIAAIIVGHTLFQKFSKGFQRNAVSNSFADTVVGSTSILNNNDSVLKSEEVQESVKEYESLFSGVRKDVGKNSNAENIEERNREYETLVNSYYNLVTDFYEYGWGQSFHFAPRRRGETFEESICRSEYYLALRTAMGKDSKVLDVGCGVGGPLRNIAAFSGADVTGVTINDYQVKVGNKYCELKGLEKQCRITQGDFQKLTEKFDKETFDVAYAIEATCHSPDRKVCFSGVSHCLKKGGLFAGYEWCMLPSAKNDNDNENDNSSSTSGGYDETNPNHVRVKEGIEVGNGLPTLTGPEDVLKALEDAGFEILDAFDANQNKDSEYEIPWYQTLQGSMSLKGFRMTQLGRVCTHVIVATLEFLRIAPKGSLRVSSLLRATAFDLVEGGEEGIFTPSFFFLARKK